MILFIFSIPQKIILIIQKVNVVIMYVILYLQVNSDIK